MTHSLHALVIQLVPQNAGLLPGTVGELAHAAFYVAVQAVDPALASQMHDPANTAHLHRLLQLAFYTGIGYKTTHGLGQVRVLSPES